MEKILNTQGLGVAGRQNELIELALTYKFKGVEVDMEDLVGRHDAMGKEFACQFLQSAKIELGTFQLPITMGASDSDYAAFESKIPTIVALCEALSGSRCCVVIETSSETEPKENMERHRVRLHSLGATLGQNNIKLGLALQQVGSNEKEHRFVQTAEEMLALINTVGHANVGLALDTWQWIAAGGTADQISDLKPEQITELRLADVCEKADLAGLKKSDRVFPGVQDNSVSIAVFNGLQAAGYDGSVSIATDVSTFSGAFRDNVVAKISRMLDRLIANEDLNDPVKAPPVEENEGAEGEKASETPSEAASEAASDGVEKDNTGENVESVAAAE